MNAFRFETNARIYFILDLSKCRHLFLICLDHFLDNGKFVILWVHPPDTLRQFTLPNVFCWSAVCIVRGREVDGLTDAPRPGEAAMLMLVIATLFACPLL